MPNNASNPTEGLTYLEFNLNLPQQPINYATSVNAQEKTRIFETVFGYNEADISFRVTTPQFLDKVLKALDANGNPLMRWRVGIGTGNQINWLPWQQHYVLQYMAHFEGVGPAAGHYIKLFTRDLLHLIDRSNRTQAYRGTVSSIVRRLAANNNLADAVIEDTQGEGVWVQSFQGDFDFVRQRLVARARSTRGRGNYYLFVRDNVLHFHTVEYQTVVKDFAYYLSPATRLDASDVAQAKLPDGAAGVRVIVYDPYTGEAKEINSDPNKALRMGNSLPHLDRIVGGQRNVREHRIQIRDENAGATAKGQNAYEFARAESFQIKMQTSKTPFLRPGELLRVNIDPNAENISVWSGLYLVGTAQHIVEKGELNSVYILQRGEMRVARAGNNSLSAYGVDTVEDDQNAPGYDVNVRDAQSSSVTKGAGKTTSDGVFLTVQDPSKAVVPS